MDEILSSEIQINEVSEDTRKVTIKYGRDKYSFWKQKKDGGNTKAYETWLNSNFKNGDWIEIQFKEEDAEWEKDGKTIYFKRRTILQMRTASGTSDRPKSSPRSNSGPTAPAGDYVTREEYEKKIKDMSDAFMSMAKEIGDLKKYVEKNVIPLV